MGRIRTIKPEFPQSESVGRLSRDARLLFIQLWTIVDDDGRCRGNSRFLASSLYPYDDDAIKKIEGWISELESQSMIRRYIVDCATYLDIPKWRDHQRIDKARKSTLPPFQDASKTPRDHSCMDLEGEGEGEWNGRGVEEEGEISFSETDKPSSETPADETPVLEFPCDGKKRTWRLSRSQVLEWESVYPSLDVEGECRKALAWVLAKPSRKKTFGGMPAFLVSWLNRTQNSGGNVRDGPPSRSVSDPRYQGVDASRY